MKKNFSIDSIYFIVIIQLLMSYNVKSQVSINNDGTAPNSNTILHVKGNNTNEDVIVELTPAGNMGIGTTNPIAKLHVNGSNGGNPFVVKKNGQTKLMVYNNGGTALGMNNSSGTPANGLYVTGNTGLGVNNPTEKLEVNGAVKIGAYVLPSIDGSSGEVLTTDGTGNVSWAASPASTPTYSIGDFAQGGVVFWLSPDGVHGKVVNIYDIADVPWSSRPTTLIGPSAQSDNNGPGNTVAIVNQKSDTLSAAKYCSQLSVGGYDDWYLPAVDDLAELQANQVTVNATIQLYNGDSYIGHAYWTSTEYSNTQAHYKTAGLTNNPLAAKTALKNVKAIRSF